MKMRFQQTTKRMLATSTIFLVSVGLFQNCSNQKFTIASSEENKQSVPGGSGTGGDTSGVGSIPVEAALRTLQPALAVRGMACLMCHADIRSNIITDFGHGNTWYMGGASSSFDETQSWFNNLASTWQSAQQIKGTVFVPKTIAAPSAIARVGAVPNLLTLMNTPYLAKWNFDNDPLQANKPMSLKVTALPGQEKIVEKSQITIRAPSESEIAALAPSLFAKPASAGFEKLKALAPAQMVVRGSGTLAYVMNDENDVLDCRESDIVVKGTLFLRNLRVNAERGCRLYVSGSVFIEGSISYVGSGVKQNLQITSSNAISMGINLARLKNRLLVDARNPEIANVRTYADRATQAVQEAQNIGELRDAQDDYGGTRASFDYTGLLINAPMIHSRYLGQVRGTIIAELALFSLGAFHFEFDPVFGEVNVLPLLTTSVLTVN
jgi:hypothetical protein